MITGNGRLPLLLAQSLRQEGRRPIVAIAHEQETDPALAGVVDELCWVRLGEFKKSFAFLHRHGVVDVVMAGGINKTKVWQIRPDTLALRLAARLRHFHDDHLLRLVADALAEQGFTVRGVGEILPQLLAPAGCLGQCQPSPVQWRDVALGWRAAKTLGGLDIGQGVVVRDGTVIAVEAIEGTDAMIARAAGLIKGGGGCLVKVAKPQQDHRLDLPTVGTTTLNRLANAGMKLLAVEAGATLVVDPAEFIALANRLSMVVVGLTGHELDELESLPTPVTGIWGKLP
ncbi:MAG: LpxI family protein [Magnetococcales bacterium]|nr:UDP-2,3-diacylglucosamine diphosphatase LpxI [Magnetococcales bacterium]NGZ25676.1 LpxI family protein [Magnetococcales bacterium]